MYRQNFLLSRYTAQSTGSFHAATSARPFVRQCHFYRSELGRLGIGRLWHILFCHWFKLALTHLYIFCYKPETDMNRHNFLLSRYAAESTGSFHAATSARPFVRQCHFYRSELGRLGIGRLWHILFCHRVSPTASFPRRHGKWHFLEILVQHSCK